MHDFSTLAIALGASLTATTVAALLLRIGGRKPSLWNTVAIPVGITVAEAAHMHWQLPGGVFVLVPGAAVGLMVFCVQYPKARCSG